MSTEIDFEYLNIILRVLNSFYFTPTCAQEIIDVLKSLSVKGNKLFDITLDLLRPIENVIVPILVHFYNEFIANGLYPSVLKVGRVIPVYKNGNTFSVSNYRPISNLTTINKIFE